MNCDTPDGKMCPAMMWEPSPPGTKYGEGSWRCKEFGPLRILNGEPQQHDRCRIDHEAIKAWESACRKEGRLVFEEAS